eukprot:Lankesteria_metandrocarpae@DN8095_c0_g1_i1.p1
MYFTVSARVQLSRIWSSIITQDYPLRLGWTHDCGQHANDDTEEKSERLEAAAPHNTWPWGGWRMYVSTGMLIDGIMSDTNFHMARKQLDLILHPDTARRGWVAVPDHSHIPHHHHYNNSMAHLLDTPFGRVSAVVNQGVQSVVGSTSATPTSSATTTNRQQRVVGNTTTAMYRPQTVSGSREKPHDVSENIVHDDTHQSRKRPQTSSTTQKLKQYIGTPKTSTALPSSTGTSSLSQHGGARQHADVDNSPPNTATHSRSHTSTGTVVHNVPAAEPSGTYTTKREDGDASRSGDQIVSVEATECVVTSHRLPTKVYDFWSTVVPEGEEDSPGDFYNYVSDCVNLMTIYGPPNTTQYTTTHDYRFNRTANGAAYTTRLFEGPDYCSDLYRCRAVLYRGSDSVQHFIQPSPNAQRSDEQQRTFSPVQQHFSGDMQSSIGTGAVMSRQLSTGLAVATSLASAGDGIQRQMSVSSCGRFALSAVTMSDDLSPQSSVYCSKCKQSKLNDAESWPLVNGGDLNDSDAAQLYKQPSRQFSSSDLDAVQIALESYKPPLESKDFVGGYLLSSVAWTL